MMDEPSSTIGQKTLTVSHFTKEDIQKAKKYEHVPNSSNKQGNANSNDNGRSLHNHQNC